MFKAFGFGLIRSMPVGASGSVERRFYSNVDKAVLTQKLKDGVLLIDVREPAEVAESGTIEIGPNKAKNVPLNELETALSLRPADFNKKYGFSKPNQTDEIAFTCAAGKRSKLASQMAERLKYANVLNYTGGVFDWLKN